MVVYLVVAPQIWDLVLEFSPPSSIVHFSIGDFLKLLDQSSAHPARYRIFFCTQFSLDSFSCLHTNKIQQISEVGRRYTLWIGELGFARLQQNRLLPLLRLDQSWH